jgi:putative transposase
VGVFRIEKNTKVVIAGSVWRLRKKINETTWRLEEANTERYLDKTEEELFVMHVEGQLRAVLEHPGQKGTIVPRKLSDAEKDEIQWRLMFVKAVYDLPTTQDEYETAIATVWKDYQKRRQQGGDSGSSGADSNVVLKCKKAPNWSTAYRWVLRYKASGNDTYALLKKDRFDQERAESEVIDAIDEALEEDYLTRERSHLSVAIVTAKQRVKDANEKREALGLSPFKLPSRRNVERRLKLIPAFDVHAARRGRQSAIMKFRAVSGHRTTTEVLARVEIDHTPLDLFVVDDETGLPLGRPYITMCIEDFTRCILGLYVGFIPPSYQSVALCLKHAFLPKVYLKREYPEVRNSWDPCGVMRTLVTDQGAEFHSEALEEACNRLGINIEYAPRKTGWYKAKIERVLRRLNEEVAHGTPGTTFSNIFERGDYNPEKFAVVRMSTLRLALHLWVCDVYHQKPHCALGMPPATMWKMNIRTQEPLAKSPNRQVEKGIFSSGPAF